MKHALLFVFPLANLSRSSNVNWMEDGQKKTEETFCRKWCRLSRWSTMIIEAYAKSTVGGT